MSTPPATPPDTSRTDPAAPGPNALARQVRVYRTLALCLAGLLLLGGGAVYYLRRLGQPVAIFLDGRPMGTARNASAADALLADAERAKLGAAFAGEQPVRLQKVRLERVPAGAAEEPDRVLRDRLTQALRLHVHAYVISVNGRPALALPTQEEAAQTLRLVKDHWADQPLVSPPQGQPEFLERVDIQKRAVDTGLTRQNAASAAPYFWTPPAAKTYTVRRGDIASRIAHRAHLSLRELITANPNANLNRLRPGDLLHVQKTPQLLTVRVRKAVVADEKVQPNAPASEAGRQRVTYIVTYLNGHETRREARSVEVLTRPRMRMTL